jgi:hypothetical protein
MNEVSLFRLYLLRAIYLLCGVGLCVVVWPNVIHRAMPWEAMEGVTQCMLASFALMSLLGVRYPLQMLPVLLWELVWKTIWLIVVAAPLWSSGQMDKENAALASQILWVVIIPFGIPWGYVFANYVKKPGNRWSPSTAPAANITQGVGA